MVTCSFQFSRVCDAMTGSPSYLTSRTYSNSGMELAVKGSQYAPLYCSRSDDRFEVEPSLSNSFFNLADEAAQIGFVNNANETHRRQVHHRHRDKRL